MISTPLAATIFVNREKNTWSYRQTKEETGKLKTTFLYLKSQEPLDARMGRDVSADILFEWDVSNHEHSEMRGKHPS